MGRLSLAPAVVTWVLTWVAATGCAAGVVEDLRHHARDAHPLDGMSATDAAPSPEEDSFVAPKEDTGGPAEPDTSPPPPDTYVEPPVESGPPPVSYPPGPYGKVAGAILPNVTWKGYVDGKGTWGDISSADYYDPSGSKGIRAIWIGMSATWCSVCNAEASRLGLEYPSYKSRGARFVTLMIEDGSHKPATQLTVDAWIKYYALVHDVCADPAMSLAPSGSFGLPYNIIVDPRTMKIVKIVEGDGPIIESTINALIKTNGG